MALTDADLDLKAHAAHYIDIILAESRLNTIQTETDWMTVDELRASVEEVERPDSRRRIIMLRDSETPLKDWACQRGDVAVPSARAQ